MKTLRAIFLMGLISASGIVAQEAKMRLYVFYTPSHEKMFKEWFLPSLAAEDDFEIIAEQFQQDCRGGAFMQTGWLPTMIHKVDLVLRGIKENWGSVFIHADVDIQFFKPIKATIKAAIEGKDMVLQQDHPNGVICAGFFACRGNEKTFQLWSYIKSALENEVKKIKNQKKTVKSSINDQTLLNKYIRFTNPYKVVWGYLPPVFFSGGTLTGKHWAPGDMLPIPEDIVMHHANWTVGIENKIAQLEYVHSEVEKRQHNA